MTTAFVLSGGGSLGAVQAGMLAALEEQGLRPDLLIGTSAGALNAAYLGAHGYSSESIADLATLWRGLRRQDVFPVDPLRSVLALSLIHIFSYRGLDNKTYYMLRPDGSYQRCV